MIRKIVINEGIIAYRVRFSDRARKVSIRIKNGDAVLVVPKNFPLHKAERFFESKIDWVKKHIAKTGDEVVPTYFGENVIPKTIDGKMNFVRNSDDNINYSFSEDELQAFENWLYEKAKSYLPKRTEELADKFNLVINKVTVRRQKTRWGSCSGKKNISLNYKLLQFDQEVIDYVIVHELCHTVYMNHSTEFWILVARVIQNYKKYKSVLRGRNIL